MPSMSAARLSRLAVTAVCLCLWGCGGTDEQATGPFRPVEGPVVLSDGTALDKDTSAEDFAWACLQVLRRYVEAARSVNAADGRERLERARQDLFRLSAYEAVRETVAEMLDTESLSLSDQYARQAIELWPAAVAHYVQDFDRMRLEIHKQKAGEAEVRITASNPRDAETASRVRRQLRQQLANEGLAGEALAERLKVLLRRRLARLGVGLPVEATIALDLVKVRGYWRLGGVRIVPPKPAKRQQVPRPGGAVDKGD